MEAPVSFIMLLTVSSVKVIVQIELMLEMEKKAEIQCLSAIASSYLLDVYLPNKLKYGGWI